MLILLLGLLFIRLQDQASFSLGVTMRCNNRRAKKWFPVFQINCFYANWLDLFTDWSFSSSGLLCRCVMRINQLTWNTGICQKKKRLALFKPLPRTWWSIMDDIKSDLSQKEIPLWSRMSKQLLAKWLLHIVYLIQVKRSLTYTNVT